MNNSTEIKKANRKALPKFLLLVVIGGLIGGVVGFFSADFDLDTLSVGMKAAGEIFGMYVAPWLMLAIAIIMPVIAILLYKRATKLLATWDGEDEEVSDAVDEKLSIAIWISSTALIISFFLLAASYPGENDIFDSSKNILMIFISIAAYFAIMIEAVIIQQKCVDATKKLNPEKTASIYDMKFKKKWLDSCDEAEKILIGKCAYKAFSATNIVCTILAGILTVCAMTFGIGLLPTLVVCIIWIVNQSVYSKEAIKYSKAGNKII